ncbi:MAG: response regulator [Spirochaetales bacterium]|nr:response regulator [Spirochaetales bacterium]
MAQGKILIVEDEKDILELLSFNLEREGYEIFKASTGEEALDQAQKNSLDLVLLDLMLPGMDGLKVCKRLKQKSQTANVPVLMLTAKSEENDIVFGLESGADDYVTKPFSPKILVARIRTLLRRNQTQGETESPDSAAMITIFDLEIDKIKRRLKKGGEEIQLSMTEFDILHFLAEKPGWVFSREQIINAIKGNAYHVTDRSVDVQILGLRKKLGSAGNLVETVRGVGYRFKDPL